MPVPLLSQGGLSLRRLIDHTKGVRSAKHFIPLKTWVKGDLRLWNSFLDDFKDHSFFHNDTWHDSRTLNLYTDAAASLDFGAIFGPFLPNCPQRPFTARFDAKSAYHLFHGQCGIGRCY